MIKTRESVATTANRIISDRPVLEPIIKAFESLFEARASLPKELLPLVEEIDFKLPEFTADYASQGRSLLSALPLEGFDSLLTASAKKILPELAKQEHFKPYIPVLETYFIPAEKDVTNSKEDSSIEKSEEKISKAPQSYKLAEAYIANDATTMEEAAKALDIPAEVIIFVFHFILGAVLQAVVAYNIPVVAMDADLDEETVTKATQAPWDKNSIWREGYCPVCSSFPSISYLDRALVDENNQFLSSGGGKKYCHCSLCSTNWQFRRGACPSCNEEGPEVMQILKEEGNNIGERIDWCTKCNSYCPSIDLRDRGVRPNFEMMALGMMHLDMIAAEKKLIPLSPAFWNTF